MKRIIAILFVLIMSFSMVACFDNSKTQEPTSETITIHDGSNSFEVQAEFDKDLNIIKTYKEIYSGKQGYYIEGVYDAETEGEKYFDQEGVCKAVWSENFPKDFYVRWESIDNYKLVDDNWWNDKTNPEEYESAQVEESFRYSRHYFSSEKGYTSNYLIISNNRDRIMDVNIKLRAKTSGGGNGEPNNLYVYLCDGKEKSKEVHAKLSKPITTTYSDFEYSMQCSMKAFGYEEKNPQRCLYIMLQTGTRYYGHKLYYKDMHMTITILPEQQ